MLREKLAALSYDPSIPLFGRDHLIYLALCAIFTAAFLILCKRTLKDEEQINRFARVLGIVLIVHLFFEMFFLRVVVAGIPLANSLPLHLCNFGLLAVGILLITRKQILMDLAYFWALAGATQSLLTPNLKHIFPHPLAVTFFTAHVLEIVGLLFACMMLGLRPHWKSIPKALGVTAIMAVLVFPVNFILDKYNTNYMFLKFKPPGGSLLDFMGPWPWYLLSLVGVAAFLFVLVYLPYAVSDWVKAAKAGK